jgi:hypothetical protein
LRSTHDIDFVVQASPEQLSALIAALQRDGYYAELDAAIDARRHESFFKWKALDQNYLSRWIDALQLQEQLSAAKQFAEIAD